jgi:alcohol dehydrogenase (cytochrome c)/quinohemoprotein ethanol dehydrogenase
MLAFQVTRSIVVTIAKKAHTQKLWLGALCGATLLAAGCSGETGSSDAATATAPAPKFAAVDGARLLAANAPENAGQWMSYGRDYEETRFSPLKAIDTETVKGLGLAWYGDFDTRRGQESTPIVVDGVIYVTTAWSKIYAYEAKTGKQLWQFDPKVPGEWAVNACCDVVNRGVAAWNGKVYIGTIDGRLIAVDAASGEAVWDIYTIDRDKPYSITGAPRVVKGMVLIGNGGAEFSQRGYVSAYDAETGKMVWRWYTVPGDPKQPFENPQMEMAAKTWGGEWWKKGGGGTVWDAITYDPKTDLVFIGTGNGAPWPAEIRDPGGKGDHLFLSSIVALKPENGEYVWHYQQVQRDSWDYTAVQQITVADLEIDGKARHVVMQAPKNGYFYVLDAASGELISAKPIVPLNWSTGIDMKTGRPIMNPAARYDVTGKGFIAVPHFGGAHSWPPMSYSPETKLVYIPTMEISYPFVATREDDNPMGQHLSISFAGSAAMLKDPKALRVSKAYLLAWDPVKQQEVWRVPHAAGRSGGSLATAGGLVFAGNTEKQEFAAYRADNGEKLWAQPAYTGVMAGPSTFEVDGEQYVAVVSGFRQSGDYWAPNYSRLLVYKLGGTAKLPDPVTVQPRELNPPPAFGTAEAIAHGQELYGRFCSTCHGNDGFSRGMFPDLRYAGALNSAEAFKAIVIDGALTANGMVSFAKALKPDEPEAIRAYLVSRAIEAKKNPPPIPGAPVAAPAARPHQ